MFVMKDGHTAPLIFMQSWLEKDLDIFDDISDDNCLDKAPPFPTSPGRPLLLGCVICWFG